MSLSKQLSRWHEAGLIDARTQEGILEFEARRARPRMVHALAALGAVSIGVGIISMVAANWDGISPSIKLGADLMLAAALALGAYQAVRRRASLLAEALGIVYYLFTLASLGLVGQVYQLGTPTWQALATWSLVTLPLAFLLRSYLAGALWFIGFGTSYVITLTEVLEDLEPHTLRDDAAVALISAWPLVVMLVARVPWLFAFDGPGQARRRFLHAVDVCSWGVIVTAGFLVPFAFYTHVGSDDTLDVGLVGVAGACLALHFCQRRCLHAASKRAQLGVSLVLGVSWLTFSLGAGVPHPELALVGALLQVFYLGLLAFTSLELGWARTFHLLTAVIALRILIIYFEVFASMLSTGLGLITGGVLTLFLAWLWKRKSRELWARLGDNQGTPHAS
jgi:hypothetical protein